MDNLPSLYWTDRLRLPVLEYEGGVDLNVVKSGIAVVVGDIVDTAALPWCSLYSQQDMPGGPVSPGIPRLKY